MIAALQLKFVVAIVYVHRCAHVIFSNILSFHDFELENGFLLSLG